MLLDHEEEFTDGLEGVEGLAGEYYYGLWG